MASIGKGFVAVALGIFLLLGSAGVARSARRNEKLPVPDFTKGGKPDKTHDWTLGPTGARGWIWGWQGETFDARQILITAVDSGSPADGVLKKGDVILGVAGRKFDGDARVQFARAITEAEKNENRGELKLIRWRPFESDQGKAGKCANVTLKLAVMGSYSDTAPYDCAKSRKIFELGCRAIAAKGFDQVNIPNDLNALALLASGKDEYKPMLAAYAKQAADLHLVGMATWNYGYANMFLAEYYLATGDESVLPGIKRIAMEAALGQSNVGTWGHKFSRPDGILNGYGAMNQPGLSLMISMLLARRSGIHDPELDRAITKAAAFLRWYVNKGAIPYGDHQPWPDHEDNGKCSLAAVMFDMLGDADASSFFARMSLAAWPEREAGHTGNFFNVLWALPGVSRGGKKATAAYFKKDAWYYDLARKWDGSFVYQGTPANWGGNAYHNWDSTGAYLLTYAVGLRSLYLTGNKPSCVPAFAARKVAETMAVDEGFNFWNKATFYDHETTDKLLALLTSWSPAVRTRAASSLGKRSDDVVPALLKMLDSTNANARYGACMALRQLGAKAAAAGPTLRKLLADSDPWVRNLAAQAINAGACEDAKAAADVLMAKAARHAADDPREIVQRSLSNALFAKKSARAKHDGVLYDSLNGADRKLLYPAIRRLLTNEDSEARQRVGRIYPLLSDADLQALLPDIIGATAKMAPSNTMFADNIRLMGLDLLSRRHIAEGMHLCIVVIEPSRWHTQIRLQKCLPYLLRYGKAAQAVVPELKKVREEYLQIERADRRRNYSEQIAAIDKAIADIQTATEGPKVQTAAEFMKSPAPK